MEQLPGEDKLHKFLKANNIVLMRSRSPFGEAFKILHHMPKTQMYSELGVFTIKREVKMANLDNYPAMIMEQVTHRMHDFKDEIAFKF
jgi:hypothetical protein